MKRKDYSKDSELIDFLEKNGPNSDIGYTGWEVQTGSYESNAGLVRSFRTKNSIRQALEKWKNDNEKRA